MTELGSATADGSEDAQAWWLRFPPSVDEAVLSHGKAVSWLAALGTMLAVGLFWLHEGALACAHDGGAGVCGFLHTYVDPVLHALSWAVVVGTLPLVFLAYARLRHGMRRWQQAVPFVPRRRLFELAVEDGRLPRDDLRRLEDVYGELVSGDTMGERLRIRADFLWAWGVAFGVAAAAGLTLLLFALFLPGQNGLFAFALLVGMVAGASAVCVIAARRVATMAFDAGKWERHTARLLLDRVLDRVGTKG